MISFFLNYFLSRISENSRFRILYRGRCFGWTDKRLHGHQQGCSHSQTRVNGCWDQGFAERGLVGKDEE